VPAHAVDKAKKAEGSGGVKEPGNTSLDEHRAKRVRVDSPDHHEVEEQTEPSLRTPAAELADTPGDMGLEGITLQERLFREAWRGWEESLRMARRHRRLGEVAAKLPKSAEPKIIVQRLAEDEEARLKVWKTRFLGQAEGFEEEGMEIGAFGLDD